MPSENGVVAVAYAPVGRPTRPGRTGASWRTWKPVLDYEKCTKCYMCWKFCPDLAIDLDGEG